MNLIRFKKLREDAVIPSYATYGSSGFDFYSLDDDFVLYSGNLPILVSTGLSSEFEREFEIQIRSRSSLALKGIIIPNSPGTIDSDYRGEIKIALANVSNFAHVIKKGDRIAQGIFSPVIKGLIMEFHTLTETERGSGGFGSTGR